MKKVIILLSSVILIFSIFLMGCSGVDIAFTSYSLKPIEDFNSNNLGIDFGNIVSSREELIGFYNKAIFVSVDKQSELDKYDDSYFENKSLLIVIFASDKNSNKSIKSVSRKDDNLWITLETTSMKELNEISRFFIEVNKEDVSNIKDINYKQITII
ncbi:MAG: hypothetical protein K2L52_02905 [Clostridia bacterium]|nr:hypothetical protein [Clostridia bacterium]